MTVPTLVIHGGDDRFVPSSASAVLESNPNVTCRVYPGLRHELHNEPEGEQVVGDVVAWLDAGLRGGRAAIGEQRDGVLVGAGSATIVALEP